MVSTNSTAICIHGSVLHALQGSRARLEAAVQHAMQHNVNHWAVGEVCDWADYIGLGQYRKKFVHHCIDGRLLLCLTDRDVKVTAAPSCRHHAHVNMLMCMHLCCGSLKAANPRNTA